MAYYGDTTGFGPATFGNAGLDVDSLLASQLQSVSQDFPIAVTQVCVLMNGAKEYQMEFFEPNIICRICLIFIGEIYINARTLNVTNHPRWYNSVGLA